MKSEVLEKQHKLKGNLLAKEKILDFKVYEHDLGLLFATDNSGNFSYFDLNTALG